MMANIIDFVTGQWAHRIGWTLLHSLWQSAAIALAVFIALRIIPGSKSQLRYAVSCNGLLLIVISSCITYVLLGQSATVPAGTATPYAVRLHYPPEPETNAVSNALSIIPAFIGNHMPWIVSGWLAGFFFFGFRFAAGLLYNQRIISSAIPLENEWTHFIEEAGKKLGINRLISLAQSAAVSAPVVIGYLRPVILIPAGMLTGLSSDQLQTIFLHELAHIKRYDYLVNVVQSFVEVLFFFNPFVWTLSGHIRREREYCCDDVVIRRHGAKLAYAYALAQLAENSRATPSLALSLTGDKNQLLNRIRRIMEKSVGNYSGKTRMMVPAMLLIAGLFCISWLGIQKGEEVTPGEMTALADTIIDKQNGARYSRRSIITIDENGQPHEEIVEEFEGDESLRPLLDRNLGSLKAMPFLMPPLAPSSPDPLMQGFPSHPDTIPPAPFSFRADERWEQFSRLFEEKFGEGFEDVFTLRENDLSQLLRDMEENLGSEEWERRFHFDFPPQALDSAAKFFDNESFKDLEEELLQLRELNLERLEMFRNHMQSRARGEDRYEDVLLEELKKDGYLGDNETIRSMEWNDDTMKVNGKAIREADQKKYRELNHQYFNRPRLHKLE